MRSPSRRRRRRSTARWPSSTWSSPTRSQQATIQAGSQLADDVVNAVDIRESDRLPGAVPASVPRHEEPLHARRKCSRTRKSCFAGTVIRARLSDARTRARPTRRHRRAPCSRSRSSTASAPRDRPSRSSFADLRPIGAPPAADRRRKPLGILDQSIEEIALRQRRQGAGVEQRQRTRPGDGAGPLRRRLARASRHKDAVYARLGEMALVSAGRGRPRPGRARPHLDRAQDGLRFRHQGRRVHLRSADARRRTWPTSFTCSPPSWRCRGGMRGQS